MMLPAVAVEASDQEELPCGDASYTRGPLSCLAPSLRNLQSLMEDEDFDEISDVFLRICRETSTRTLPAQQRSKVIPSRGPSQASQSSNVSMRMYFGGTRPSSASTAVPSSSLSLCSASMEPPSAPELPQEQANVSFCMNYESKPNGKNGFRYGASVAGTKRLEGRKEGSEGGSRPSAVVAGQENRGDTESSASDILDNDASCYVRTPSNKVGAVNASKGETRRKATTLAPTPTFLTRRSPRLQKPSQGTPRHEGLPSPALKGRQLALQQQQAWAAASRDPSSAAEKSRKQLSGGKRRQGVAAASIGPKRQREEGNLEFLNSQRTGGKPKQQTHAGFVEGETRAVSPPKNASNKRKGNCRGNSAKTSSVGKQACNPETRGAKPWQRKKARLCKHEGRTTSEAPEVPSPAQSHEASEPDDEPICHFAIPVLKEGADTASGVCPQDGDTRLIALSHTSVAAVQREEACMEADLRPDEATTPGDEQGRVGALQHKVLRALPEPTPQFDFGLFIVRAAAMSKHVDDIFPLLEDEELMERSIVLEKYLGPPKEGAKRRGDHFMLDKLVADIPNHGGVYRPFLDIKEAPWCTGLDTGDGKALPKKEVLRQRIEAQRRWNPFSIFGSSPPSVELEDVFGYEVYQRTAPSARVHHPLFRRLSQFQSFKDLYSTLSKEEWDRVSSAFRHHWNKQCRLDLDWTNDPLTIDEIMWMLEANEQVEDRSSHVYEAEICYCVTPNPNVGFGWNDPRCHRYKAPRPSMGCHILTQPPLVDGFLDDKGDAEAAQEPSTRGTSSLSEPAPPLKSKTSSEEVPAKSGYEEQTRGDSIQAATLGCDAPDEKQQVSTESLPAQVRA